MWLGWAWYRTSAWLSVLEGRSSALHVQLRLCYISWQLPVSVVCISETGLCQRAARLWANRSSVWHEQGIKAISPLQAHNRNSDDTAWVGIGYLFFMGSGIWPSPYYWSKKWFACWLKFYLGCVDIAHERRIVGLGAQTATVSTNLLPSCG